MVFWEIPHPCNLQPGLSGPLQPNNVIQMAKNVKESDIMLKYSARHLVLNMLIQELQNSFKIYHVFFIFISYG